MWKNEQNEFPNAGHRIDRKEVDYSLQGSAASKIFRAFNALGTIAFSFGDAMLPEIQVNIWYYAEIHAVSVHSTPKLHWNSELCARTGEDEHVQRRVDGVLDHRHVLLDPGIQWVLGIWLRSTALHPVLPDFSKMDNCDGKSICSHSDHWLLSGNTPVTSFFFTIFTLTDYPVTVNLHQDILQADIRAIWTADSGERRRLQSKDVEAGVYLCIHGGDHPHLCSNAILWGLCVSLWSCWLYPSGLCATCTGISEGREVTWKPRITPCCEGDHLRCRCLVLHCRSSGMHRRRQSDRTWCQNLQILPWHVNAVS